MPVRQGVTIRIIFKTNLTHITAISATKCKFWGQKKTSLILKRRLFTATYGLKLNKKIILLYKDDTVIFIQLKRNSDCFCTTAGKPEKHSFYIIKEEVHKNNYKTFHANSIKTWLLFGH
jgi:hypothetical protein